MDTRPAQESRVLSHGRGGAGNVVKDDPTASQPKPEDLVTPTLKANTYTTGRGGTGNMAQNDPGRPEVARAAQDVEAPKAPSEAKGPIHYGRGGAANIVDKGGQQNSSDAKRKGSNASLENVKREDGAAKGGLLAKGKELLNKIKK